MKKAKIALLVCTAAFLCVLAGVYIGRQTGSSYIQLPAGSDNAGQLQQYTPETNPQMTGKININTASVSQLTLLPGIGESLAQRIIEYRQTNGSFQTIDDLSLVSGIGEKKLEAIRDFITVGG